MPLQATLYNVFIASPGDVQVERNIVREAIHEWNAIHSAAKKTVLQPIGWETHSRPSMADRAQGILNTQLLENADLLVAIFWTRLGTPTGEAASGTVEEIEHHLDAGKPAMIYFSSTPVRPDSVDTEQYKSLLEFREKCMARGLVHSYDSPAEFSQAFSRHLASTINDDVYFENPQKEDVLDAVNFGTTYQRQLSSIAKTLLSEAAQDPHGHILHMKTLGGEHISTNGKQYIEDNNPRSRAQWVAALNELIDEQFIHDVGYKGEIFQLTKAGYDFSETLQL